MVMPNNCQHGLQPGDNWRHTNRHVHKEISQAQHASSMSGRVSVLEMKPLQMVKQYFIYWATTYNIWVHVC